MELFKFDESFIADNVKIKEIEPVVKDSVPPIGNYDDPEWNRKELERNRPYYRWLMKH